MQLCSSPALEIGQLRTNGAGYRVTIFEAPPALIRNDAGLVSDGEVREGLWGWIEDAEHYGWLDLLDEVVAVGGGRLEELRSTRAGGRLASRSGSTRSSART